MKNKKYYIIAIILLAAGVFLYRVKVHPKQPNVLAQTEVHVEFPTIDTSQLSSSQQKVVSILKQEFDSQPDGKKYSEGSSEPWCSDFVSWVYREAGKPLTNPNSGSWRIPGTVTLRDYYQSKGKFKSAASGYSPKVGDIMLYDNPSHFGHHVNIVVKNEGGIITTVGGNEPGGIRVYVHTPPDGEGFLGYGIF